MSGTFRPLVLCYHAVTDGWTHALAIGPAALESQLRGLVRRRWRPAAARETVAGRGRLLHVTFDDAFRSVARAVPVLERLGIPATVFACPSYADDGRPLDVPELAADARRLPDELATMRWDELRELSERGVEIGSHTVSHPHLTRLSDSELDRELRTSRERLEEELNRPCPLLAYPYGEEDPRVQRAAERAGFNAAFALPGRDSLFNRYALPRVGMYRDNSRAKLLLKTTPAFRRPAAAVLARFGRRL